MWICRNKKCRAENYDNVDFCYKCGKPRQNDKTPFDYKTAVIVSCFVVIAVMTIWIVDLLLKEKQSPPVQQPEVTTELMTEATAEPMSEPQTHVHEWEKPNYSWSSNYSNCTANRVCTTCGETETETAPGTVYVLQEAGCTQDGKNTYSASFQNPDFTIQQVEKDIPAFGHKWTQVTFSQPKTCSVCGLIEGYPSPKTVPPTLNELQTIMESGKINTVCKADSGELVSLELPTEYELLDYPFRAVIANGNADYPNIFVMPKHRSGNGDLGLIKKGTEVWIVAKYEGKTFDGNKFTYYFFVADDGVMGWNSKNFFVQK